MSFNEKLQNLRKANKLSQEQLADMLDVTRQSVSKWESGTTYPEMDKLITMCKIFKCSLDDLTNDEITEINVEKKQNNGSFITNLVSNIQEIIDKTVKMFRAMNAKQVVGVIASLLILAIFLCIMRIPFEVLENGFYTVVMNIPNRRISGSLAGFFNMILDVVFFILYILAFIYIYKLAYLDKYEFVEKKDDAKETIEDEIIQKENETKEVKIVHESKPKNNTLFCLLGNIVIWFLRIISAICIFPFIFTLIALFAIIVIAIVMMFDGIVYMGVFLGIVFAIILNIWILEVGCAFVFNKKTSFKRLMWTFFFGLAGIGVSIGLIASEVADISFINSVPSEYERVSITKEYPMQDDLIIDDNFYYYRRIEYVENEDMVDILEIKVDHYAEMNNPIITLDDNRLSLQIYYSREFGIQKKLWELIKRDLRNKEIRNYEPLHEIVITVTSSKKNISKLKANTKAQQEKDYKNRYESCDDILDVRVSSYEDRIEALIEENDRLRERIEDLEDYKNRIKDIVE